MKINFVRTLLGVTVTRFLTTNFFINPFHFLNLLVQYYNTVFFIGQFRLMTAGRRGSGTWLSLIRLMTVGRRGQWYLADTADDSPKEGQWYLADTADDSR